MRLRGVVMLGLFTACTSGTVERGMTSDPWTHAHYANVTALIQSCSGDASIGPTLLWPGRSFFETRTHSDVCAGNKPGCAALAECFGVVVTADPLCQPGCDGDSAITCRTNYRSTTDCAQFLSVCAAGECVDPPKDPTPFGAVICPASATTPTCADGDSWAMCGASSPVRVSCATRLVGSACVDGACVLGSECTPGKILDGIACDGKSLRVCVAGRIEKVDCTALGFTGCDPFTRGCSPNPLLAP